MKKGLLIALGVVVVFVLWLVWFWPRTGVMAPKQRVTLPNGSVLTLEAVTYGRQHEFTFDTATWQSRVRQAAPGFLKRFFRGGGMTMTTTEPNGLVIWVSFLDAVTGQYGNPGSTYNLELVDGHGCTTRISSYGTGGGGKPGFLISHFALENFPRRDRTFKLRVKARPPGEQKVLAELEISNPARGPFPVWEPQPLPQVRTNGELTIALKNVRLGRGGGYIIPDTQVTRAGRMAEDWTLNMLGLEDATGNFHYSPLCTNEPAWKLKYRLLRNEHAKFSQAEAWVLTNLAVAATQQVNALSITGAVKGARFEVLAMGGPGTFVFSNGVPVAPGTVVISNANSSYSTSGNEGSLKLQGMSQRGGHAEQIDLTWGTAWLLGRAEDFKKGQEFLLRGRDERGRMFSTTTTSQVRDYHLVSLKVPEGAQRIDLEFIVHEASQVEFLIAPPRE
jgi:hypothetical protein